MLLSPVTCIVYVNYILATSDWLALVSNKHVIKTLWNYKINQRTILIKAQGPSLISSKTCDIARG